MLYHSGATTKFHQSVYGEVPPEVAANFARFANLHVSDWYFNRALYAVMLGVEYLYRRKGVRTAVDGSAASLELPATNVWSDRCELRSRCKSSGFKRNDGNGSSPAARSFALRIVLPEPSDSATLTSRGASPLATGEVL